MPTYKIAVFKHHQRRDGKFRVSIRLTHNRQSVYLRTDVYVSRKQITADFKTIKDTEVVRLIDRDIIEYENILLRNLGSNLSQYTARELADYIEKYTSTDGGAGIDFIAFCDNHIEALKAEGRDGTAGRFESVIHNLTDYFGRSTVFVKEINVKNLQGFVEYMQKPHEQMRMNQHGNCLLYTSPSPRD